MSHSFDTDSIIKSNVDVREEYLPVQENMTPVNYHAAEMRRNFDLANKAFDRYEPHLVQYHKQEVSDCLTLSCHHSN